VRWFRKSAQQGYANAQFNLGIMYHHGCGVKQDYPEALCWYSKAGPSKRSVTLASCTPMAKA